MTTISGTSESTWTINYLGDDRYQVQNPLDRDGDGVKDGESLTGAGGEVMNEAEVNRIVGAYGLKMQDGQLVSADGFTLGGTTGHAATAYGDAPVLPDVTGPMADPATVESAATALNGSEATSEAALMWLALLTMAETSMKELAEAKQLKHLMQQNKLEAKESEITATRSRIEAEKEAATQRFITAVAVAIVVAVLSLSGAGAPAGSAAAVAAASAQAIGAVVSTSSEMHSKNWGAQAQADRMQIQEKIEQKEEEAMQMAVDEAQSSYDEARELFKQALRILIEHSERQSQIVESIVRTA